MGGRGGTPPGAAAGSFTFLPGKYRDPVTLDRGTPQGDLVAAYARLSGGTTGIVSLGELREADEMRRHSRPDFDRAVRGLVEAGHAVSVAEENPRAISTKMRRASLGIGGVERHLLSIGRLGGARGSRPSTVRDGRETFRPFPSL